MFLLLCAGFRRGTGLSVKVSGVEASLPERPKSKHITFAVVRNLPDASLGSLAIP